MAVTLEDVKQHPLANIYIEKANEHLGAIGYTEHGHRHCNLVASIARNILLKLGCDARTAELAAIAAYLHDIGNLIGRQDHGIAGALLAKDILQDLKMDMQEIVQVMEAIGNHEDELGEPTTVIAAALLLADKSDVHRSRVRNPNRMAFDIHDRVNYAVEHSFLRVDANRRALTLELTIDTEIAPVMEYFEIFMQRMSMCRRAAQYLNCAFELKFNGVKLL
jgi:hypothetical protein